jgi:hypothetical protein
MSSTSTIVIGVIYTIYSFLYFVAAMFISELPQPVRQLLTALNCNNIAVGVDKWRVGAILATLPLVAHIVLLSSGLSMPPSLADNLGFPTDSYPNLTGDRKTIVMVFDLVQAAWAAVMVHRLYSNNYTSNDGELRALTVVAIYIGSIGAIFCGAKQDKHWIWIVQWSLLLLSIITVTLHDPDSAGQRAGGSGATSTANNRASGFSRGITGRFRAVQTCPDA